MLNDRIQRPPPRPSGVSRAGPGTEKRADRPGSRACIHTIQCAFARTFKFKSSSRVAVSARDRARRRSRIIIFRETTITVIVSELCTQSRCIKSPKLELVIIYGLHILTTASSRRGVWWAFDAKPPRVGKKMQLTILYEIKYGE